MEEVKEFIFDVLAVFGTYVLIGDIIDLIIK